MFYSNFIQIDKASKLIRNDILHMSINSLESFPSDCQETVSQSHLTLVNMLLYGTELTSQPALSLSHMIMFNKENH